MFADAANGDRRTIDVGGREHPGYAGHHEQHVAEVRGESLRLAYVALTRSCHQTVRALGDLVGQPGVGVRPHPVRRTALVDATSPSPGRRWKRP